MALFLGTYNVPTNKKLRVNTTDVTEVYSNGVLVWKYVKPIVNPGTGTGTGTGTGHVPGGKGAWVQLPQSSGNTVRVQTNYTDNHSCITSAVVVDAFVGGGRVQLGATYAQGSFWHNGSGDCKFSDHTQIYYHIMKWVPAP